MKRISKAKPALPPGMVAAKGANIAKIKRWHDAVGEPDNLAHAGVGTRMRMSAAARK